MNTDVLIAQPVDNDVAEMLSRHGKVTVNPGPDPYSTEELKILGQDARALMAFMTEQIDEDVLSASPSLRIVAGALKGFDNIDVDACSARGVAVSIVPDLLTKPTAELALGLMIAVSRQVLQANAYVRAGKFKGWRPRFFGDSIDGATIGVVGMGLVGQALLKLLTGFDCETCYYDTNPLDAARERVLGAVAAPLDAVMSQSDFVVLALPLTPATLGIVDSAFIAKMKPGSYLINPARGSLVDEAAVVDALERDHLAGYAADVFEAEDWARRDRPDTIHPGLISSQKTVLTPHIGSAVTQTRRQIVISAAESIDAVLDGRTPDTIVNRDALKEFSHC